MVTAPRYAASAIMSITLYMPLATIHRAAILEGMLDASQPFEVFAEAAAALTEAGYVFDRDALVWRSSSGAHARIERRDVAVPSSSAIVRRYWIRDVSAAALLGRL
jgi:hypothetical protein